MKTILTIIFVLFIGMAVRAQSGTFQVKIEAVAMGIVTVSAEKAVPLKSENTVVRLYRTKNAKVTKALSFITKLDKAKLV